MSMSHKRGITEKSVWLLNPLPPTTDAEALEKAKLDDLMAPKDFLPFRIEWHYGGGVEKEYVNLAPGKRILMRESDAEWFMKECAERGLVKFSVDADDDAIRRESIAGVRKAITFHAERGNKALSEVRKKHSYSKEDMDDRRHEFFSYHYNEALSHFARLHLKSLETPTAAPKKAKA